jgi:hypothetical protein
MVRAYRCIDLGQVSSMGLKHTPFEYIGRDNPVVCTARCVISRQTFTKRCEILTNLVFFSIDTDYECR